MLMGILLLWPLAACDVAPDAPEAAPETLLQAAERGDTEQISRLLEQPGQAVDQRDACLFTPLMKAALNGRLEAARRLIDNGAQVDLQDKGGYTALMLAASNNFVELVDYLVTQGAEVDHVEHSNGWTALIWASRLGHRETVQLLLRHNGDPTIRDQQGLSASDHARLGGHDAVLELLQPGASG